MAMAGIPSRKLYALARQHFGPPALVPGATPRLRSTVDAEESVIETFARLVVQEGLHPNVAALRAGISPSLGFWYMRNSLAYLAARDRAIAEMANSSGSLPPGAMTREPITLITENARMAATLQSRMLAGEEPIRHEVIKLTDSAMDRAGFKAPERSVAKVEYSLTPETISAIGALRRGEEIEPPPVDFTTGSWAKVLEKPQRRLQGPNAEFERMDKES
jgi:hypothetical protein